MIQAETRTPFAIRGRTLLGALALMAALGLGAAGGYGIRGLSAASQAETTQATPAPYSIQLGPASRWTHEEQTSTYPFQLGPAPRSTHEER